MNLSVEGRITAGKTRSSYSQASRDGWSEGTLGGPEGRLL